MSRENKYKIGLCVWFMILWFVMSALNGCNTAQGVFEDSAWILQKTADNIQTKD